MKFDTNYWKKYYSDPLTMDGISNRKDHSAYAKAFFDLEGVKIKRLVDLGFGYGYLLNEFTRKFKPNYIEGIEPSVIFNEKIKNLKGKLRQIDIEKWSLETHANPFDLAICTSVFQYISDKKLNEILPRLKKKVKYLYLTVPTDQEYMRQWKEFKFKDEEALKRSQKQYFKLLSPHFTFIGLRLLESKHFFNNETTPFQDLLFRF